MARRIKHETIAILRMALLPAACLVLVPLITAESAAQTPAPAANAANEQQLKDAEDLYILKDVPEPADAGPQLDIGKVGKKGTLSLERMPLDSDSEYDTRPRGAGGVRLKIPLGKQAP